jgi:hypothetical protein
MDLRNIFRKRKISGSSNKKGANKNNYPELNTEGRRLLNVIRDSSVHLTQRLTAQKELYSHHGISYKGEKINRKYIVWLTRNQN